MNTVEKINKNQEEGFQKKLASHHRHQIKEGKKGTAAGFMVRLNRVLFPEVVEQDEVGEDKQIQEEIAASESSADVSTLNRCIDAKKRPSRSRTHCNSLLNLHAPPPPDASLICAPTNPSSSAINRRKSKNDEQNHSNGMSGSKSPKEAKSSQLKKERRRRRRVSSESTLRRLSGMSILGNLETFESDQNKEPELVAILSTKVPEQRSDFALQTSPCDKENLHPNTSHREGKVSGCTNKTRTYYEKGSDNKEMRKIRRGSRQSSRRFNGMDILGSLEPFHRTEMKETKLVTIQSTKIPQKRSSSIARKKRELMPRRRRTELRKTIPSEEENIHQNTCNGGENYLGLTVSSRKSSLSATSIFENLPASIVTPFLSSPFSSPGRLGREDMGQPAASSPQVLSPPRLFNAERPNSNHHKEQDDDTSDEDILLSPSIAPKPLKRKDTRLTPVHMKNIGHDDLKAKSQKKMKSMVDTESLLSPSMGPKPLKRVDTKKTPIHHESETIENTNTVQEEKFVHRSVTNRETKLSDDFKTVNKVTAACEVREERFSKNDDYTEEKIVVGSGKNGDMKMPSRTSQQRNRQLATLAEIHAETIDNESMPHELSVKNNATGWTKLLMMNGADTNKMDGNVRSREIRRSNRSPRPVDRFMATFKRKRKRGSKKRVKAESRRANISDAMKGSSSSKKKSSPRIDIGRTADEKRMTTPKRDLRDDSIAGVRRSSRTPRTVDRLSISFRRKRNTKTKTKKVDKTPPPSKNDQEVSLDSIECEDIIEGAGHSTDKKSSTPNRGLSNDAGLKSGVRRSSRTHRSIDRLSLSFRKKRKTKRLAKDNKTSPTFKKDAEGFIDGCIDEDIIEDIIAMPSRLSKPSGRSEKSPRPKNINKSTRTSLDLDETEAMESPEEKIEPEKKKMETESTTNDTLRRSSRKAPPIERLQPTFRRRSKSKKNEDLVTTVSSTKPAGKQRSALKEIMSTNIPIKEATERKIKLVREVISVPRTEGWDATKIAELKIAHKDANPLSSFFWQNVASKVPGMTAEDCRDKWFAMGSPAVRRKKSAHKKIKDEGTKANESDSEIEDDIFNSTPVRNGSHMFKSLLDMATPNQNTTGMSKEPFLGTFSSSTKKKTKNITRPCERKSEISPLAVRPKSKTYLRALRAGFVYKSKESKRKKDENRKKSYDVIESVQHGDVQLDGVLSPGGTLFIEGPDDDEFENMYNSEDEDSIIDMES